LRIRRGSNRQNKNGDEHAPPRIPRHEKAPQLVAHYRQVLLILAALDGKATNSGWKSRVAIAQSSLAGATQLGKRLSYFAETIGPLSQAELCQHSPWNPALLSGCCGKITLSIRGPLRDLISRILSCNSSAFFSRVRDSRVCAVRRHGR
jgi:hypothetical protein